MMKALTFKQYRIIDLFIMSVLLVIGETVVNLAAGSWFKNEPYSVSVVLIFLCLGIMRWNAYAAVFALVGGITTCLSTAIVLDAGSVTLQHFAIYCIGNLFALLSILLFKAFGKEKVRTNTLLTILFIVCVFLLTEFGRFCVAFISYRELSILKVFIFTDIFSGVFAMVVILALRNLDGMFEDQKSYLLRIEEKAKKDQKTEDEFANRM